MFDSRSTQTLHDLVLELYQVRQYDYNTDSYTNTVQSGCTQTLYDSVLQRYQVRQCISRKQCTETVYDSGLLGNVLNRRPGKVTSRGGCTETVYGKDYLENVLNWWDYIGPKLVKSA